MYKEVLEKIEVLEKGSRQRKMKFNPEKDVSSQERKDVEDWSTEQISSAKDTMPEMNPNAKRRQLNKWTSQTKSKKHPETGEMMYLMHRGMSGEEHKKLKQSGFNKDYMSGWTPDYDVASSFSSSINSDNSELEDWQMEDVKQKGYTEDDGHRRYGQEKLPRKTLSAWIPESQIHHIPQAIGSKRPEDFDTLDNPFKEQENEKRKERFEKKTLPKKSQKFDEKEKANFLKEKPENIYWDRIAASAKENDVDIGKQGERIEEYERSLSEEDRTGHREIAEKYAHDGYKDWKEGAFDSYYEEQDSPIAPSAFKDQKEVMVKPHQLLIENDEEREQRLLPKTPIQHIHQKISKKGGLTDKLGIPKLAASEKSISEQEVLDMMKSYALSKFNELSQEYTEEELIKGLGRAFRNGLTVVGMLHGANYIGDKLENKPQKPQVSQSRSVASEKPKTFQAKTGNSFKDRKIGNFLKAISMNESSGGKNTNHKMMERGIHQGDSAIGQYGLMPNTVKEMATRMGRRSSVGHYAKMDNSKIAESIKNNPQHEHEIANYMANRLHDRFGGDESKMAYAYFQGHNLTNDHFKTSHKDYKDHDYVRKYHKHKDYIAKNPAKPNQDKITSNQ